jgi:hypothetical protein
MPLKQMFQIQNSRGHIRTVIGFSHKGALKEYLDTYPTQAGETLGVKARGEDSGSWQYFKLS